MCLGACGKAALVECSARSHLVTARTWKGIIIPFESVPPKTGRLSTRHHLLKALKECST